MSTRGNARRQFRAKKPLQAALENKMSTNPVRKFTPALNVASGESYKSTSKVPKGC